MDAPINVENPKPEISIVVHPDEGDNQQEEEEKVASTLNEAELSSSPSEDLESNDDEASVEVVSSFQEPVPGIRPAGQVYNFGTLPRFNRPRKGFVPKMRLMFERATSLEPELRYFEMQMLSKKWFI